MDFASVSNPARFHHGALAKWKHHFTDLYLDMCEGAFCKYVVRGIEHKGALDRALASRGSELRDAVTVSLLNASTAQHHLSMAQRNCKGRATKPLVEICALI